MTIEEQLLSLGFTEQITLVRHFNGKHSDSIVGSIDFFPNRIGELMVNFNSNGWAIIFSVNDIKSIEKFYRNEKENTLIRLKSPADYLSENN